MEKTPAKHRVADRLADRGRRKAMARVKDVKDVKDRLRVKAAAVNRVRRKPARVKSVAVVTKPRSIPRPRPLQSTMFSNT
jgi:hypothetical protein